MWVTHLHYSIPRCCEGRQLRITDYELRITDSDLAARVASYRRAGRRIVFTNGCFDILHRGHITYLNRAKALGDVLIVGLNSDDSVRRLKGPNRPINSLEDRAQILAALSCIDHIVSFNSDTPRELIRVIRPDIFVKGGDYSRQTLPEASLVEELGGEVEILPYLENHLPAFGLSGSRCPGRPGITERGESGEEARSAQLKPLLGDDALLEEAQHGQH